MLSLMALHSTSSRVTKMRNGNVTVMLYGEDIFENVSHHGFAVNHSHFDEQSILELSKIEKATGLLV